MIDIESTVFSLVASEFDAQYPQGSRYGEESSSPSKFPCLTLIEEDNYTYENSLDASKHEHDAYVMYSVNVYSNKTSGAKQECKQIMNLVDEKMQSLGFVRLFCNQIKNSDKKFYRMAARYRGIVSEDYRIYRK